MSKGNTNSITKHAQRNIISLDLATTPRQRRSIISVTESSEILSTKISIKPHNVNKRPSIYTNEMHSRSFKAPNFRKDAYGMLITKGNKEHKVSFVDNVSSQRIAEVILIEAENKPKGKGGNCHVKQKKVEGSCFMKSKVKSRNNNSVRNNNNKENCSCGSGDCSVF
jgi:hypothetical protein